MQPTHTSLPTFPALHLPPEPPAILQITTVEFVSEIPIEDVLRALPNADSRDTSSCSAYVLVLTNLMTAQTEQRTIYLHRPNRELRNYFESLKGTTIEKRDSMVTRFLRMPAPSTKQAHFVELQPYDALLLLASNVMNRPVNLKNLSRYIEDCRAGKWLPTNVGIGSGHQ